MNLYAGQDRDSLRAAWREAWQRRLQGLPLEPLQLLMADLVALHPEYHALMRSADAGTAPGSAAGAHEGGNAFLHLALHLALREQLGADRPSGIAQVHRRLGAATRDPHEAEHRMIEVLGQTLWEAQRAGRLPDEQRYLEALRRL
ncbi:MAG TPA: DUF1841 family protein [Steroidobacteraceae bacterium]|nr:DUF1841 family protein [Steroidobacteraceae bacterium]